MAFENASIGALLPSHRKGKSCCRANADLELPDGRNFLQRRLPYEEQLYATSTSGIYAILHQLPGDKIYLYVDGLNDILQMKDFFRIFVASKRAKIRHRIDVVILQIDNNIGISSSKCTDPSRLRSTCIQCFSGYVVQPNGDVPALLADLPGWADMAEGVAGILTLQKALLCLQEFSEFDEWVREDSMGPDACDRVPMCRCEDIE